jgi:hypothetical protein
MRNYSGDNTKNPAITPRVLAAQAQAQARSAAAQAHRAQLDGEPAATAGLVKILRS